MSTMNRFEIASIPNNSSKGLTVRRDDVEIKVIVVRQDEAIYCYRNWCPHTGVNLDWVPDQFLDSSGTLIQCATHGALFRIEDGKCIFGPCAGHNLLNIDVQIDGEFFSILLE